MKNSTLFKAGLILLLGVSSYALYKKFSKPSAHHEEKKVETSVESKNEVSEDKKPHLEDTSKVKSEEAKIEPTKTESTPATTESTSVNKANSSRIAAKFSNGDTITVAEVEELLSTLPAKTREAPFSKIYLALLNSLVDSKILSEKAIKAGFDKDPEVLKRTKMLKELVLQKAYLTREINKLITEDLLKEKYNEVMASFPKDELETQLAHIVVKTKEDAEKLIKELKSVPSKDLEAKFKEAALSQSLDNQTKSSGGVIGWARKSALPKAQGDLIFKAEKGSILDIPFPLGDAGFSIMMIKDRRPAQPPKLEEVKSELKKALESSPELLFKVTEKLRKEAGVKLTGLDQKPMELPDIKASAKEQNSNEEKFKSIETDKLDDKMVVAEFKNGDKITLGEIKVKMKELLPETEKVPFHQVYEALVLNTVDQKIVAEKCKSEGLDKDKNVLKDQETIEKRTIQQAYVDQELSKVITPEMLKEAYNEISKMFPKNETEVRLRLIALKTKEEAEGLLKDIKSGKVKFDKDTVAKYSIEEQTKANDGDTGYLRKDSLPKEVSDIIFKQAKATLVPEVVTLGDSYCIVRVEDKRPVTPPTLEELKEDLTRAVSMRETQNLLAKLREESNVTLFDVDGTALPQPAKKESSKTNKSKPAA